MNLQWNGAMTWLGVAVTGVIIWVVALLIAATFALTGAAMDVLVFFGKVLVFGGLVAAVITFLFGQFRR